VPRRQHRLDPVPGTDVECSPDGSADGE
jgi:hypothetical protein